MSRHIGDYDTSAVVYGKFTTFRPSTGAAYTLGGTPALAVYKDNSTTQSTSGVTLTADFDGVTGLNHFAIDTSADGSFYSAGSNFDVVLTAGTIDSVSVVGAVVGSFTIRKTYAGGVVAGLNDLSAAEVNAEVVDALNVDTYAEPGQGAPAATASLAAKINYLFKAWRNKKTQTASQFALYADDAATVDQKATVTDDETTTTVGELVSGP